MTLVMFCSLLLCWVLWDMAPVLRLFSNRHETSVFCVSKVSPKYEPVRMGRARDSP